MTDSTHNNGGTTDYYAIPEGATTLQDLIEHKGMDFAIGNVFKACYRLGEKGEDTVMYDLNKIIYYAQRELNRIGNGNTKRDSGRNSYRSNCPSCHKEIVVDMGKDTDSCPYCGYGYFIVKR